MEWTKIVLPILFSGLLGVIISIRYQRRAEKTRWKYTIFEQLLGNRYDITGDRFSEALNSVFIVFHDSKDVLIALKAFHEITTDHRSELSDQKLLELFKAMCRDLKINPEPLNDDFFLRPFNTRK